MKQRQKTEYTKWINRYRAASSKNKYKFLCTKIDQLLNKNLLADWLEYAKMNDHDGYIILLSSYIQRHAVSQTKTTDLPHTLKLLTILLDLTQSALIWLHENPKSESNELECRRQCHIAGSTAKFLLKIPQSWVEDVIEKIQNTKLHPTLQQKYSSIWRCINFYHWLIHPSRRNFLNPALELLQHLPYTIIELLLKPTHSAVILGIIYERVVRNQCEHQEEWEHTILKQSSTP